MISTEIVKGVHYIGVNDRTTTRFEGIWPLPYGVSYNSYLVCGSRKNAVRDAGKRRHAENTSNKPTRISAGFASAYFLHFGCRFSSVRFQPDFPGRSNRFFLLSNGLLRSPRPFLRLSFRTVFRGFLISVQTFFCRFLDGAKGSYIKAPRVIDRGARAPRKNSP